MKLYSTPLSPYATRVRIQIAHKKLPIEISEPPVPLRTPEFKEMFILGKVPILILNDGTQMPDSWVIMEYLEDMYTDHSLRPSDPMEKANMNLLARFADTYLTPVLFPMFRVMGNMPDDAGKKELVDALKAELSKLDRLLADLPDPDSRDVHLGDIALATNMFFVAAITPMFGDPDVFADMDHIQKWWARVNKDVAIKQGMDELGAALKAAF